MKIIVSNTGYVDLEAPIQMTEDQQEDFIKFFNNMFPGEVEVFDSLEKSRTFVAGDNEPKVWSIDEYVLLLGPKSNEELAKQLDRTTMGVKMKRGHFVPDFWVWMKKKGYSSPIDSKMVKEYLKEG